MIGEPLAPKIGAVLRTIEPNLLANLWASLLRAIGASRDSFGDSFLIVGNNLLANLLASTRRAHDR